MAQKNPMALNIVFNGGLICVVMSAVRLHEDTKARAAEKAAKKTK